MNGLTPFPYYNVLHDLRFRGLDLTSSDFKLDSKFKVTLVKNIDQPTKGYPPVYDVPLRRFNFLNKKLREFPIRETTDNIKLTDFDDDFGETYSYKWKNQDGVVGYFMQFDVDKNIDIDKKSKVNSGTSLFAKNGKISITKSKLKNCTIYATGNLTINDCELEHCYIFGSGSISKIKSKARLRLIGKFNLDEVEVSESATLFLYNPDELNQGTLSISKSNFESACELIGAVSLEKCQCSGTIRIQGKSTFTETQFSGKVQVLSTNVTCDKSTLSGQCVLSNSCTITESQVSGSAFIGGKSTVSKSQISGNAILVEQASVSESTISGGIVTQKGSVSSGTVGDHGIVTGTATLDSGSISSKGILGGKGTTCKGSISGIVNNGVSCSHGAPEGQCHWDKRSCESTQKNKLIDERKSNNSPGQSDADQKSPPTTV